MSRRRGFQGKMLETFLGREVSPIIAAIARHHVPEACHQDFLNFVWTGCSTVQLKMIIRYMGGTVPDIRHIEIETFKEELHATLQLGGGINYMGTSVLMTATIPETLRMALVGRPLSALINHPLLPGDEIITRITTMGIGGMITAWLDDTAADPANASTCGRNLFP